jgi:putative hydroxymethylpyrimidine transport system permease protein
MRKSTNTGRIIYPLGTGFFLLGAWEVFVRALSVDKFLLPAPSVILKALVVQWPLMKSHVLITLQTSASGLLIAVVLAIVMGLLLDSFSFIKKSVYPFMVVSQTIPIVFIYPLFMIWFGFGVAAKIVVVTLVCFFPAAVNLIDGLAQTDPELMDLFRSMRSGRWRIFTMVRFPGALPSFFSGLRISATYCVMGAVIGEWLGAKQGMGVYMIRSYKSFSTPSVFAAILVVVFLSLVFFYLVRIIERIVISWSYIREE